MAEYPAFRQYNFARSYTGRSIDAALAFLTAVTLSASTTSDPWLSRLQKPLIAIHLLLLFVHSFGLIIKRTFCITSMDAEQWKTRRDWERARLQSVQHLQAGIDTVKEMMGPPEDLEGTKSDLQKPEKEIDEVLLRLNLDYLVETSAELEKNLAEKVALIEEAEGKPVFLTTNMRWLLDL